ncbi:MAG: tRNA uridine(34) 5-carboxymethylaminomethyl modification radical SAM/GNAT enzyme Elp3 [Parcubacteria group bacterium]|nr:tRNA uridine(34) 5-carboxymethylaminomethyl modification radical SAM/GNAT enzyme Elp3 [Parcubacteria group bacterium]MCR4342507.1 tRNA uridine(34) 5-carboxymethylaminomethyl modification radical SAM/GNAT enzyme Elp3 [Patescibacteria group bacterium]
MIFKGIKTEADIEKLKRFIAKDKSLYKRVLKIKNKITFRSNKYIYKTKPLPVNAEILALYKDMVEKGEEKISKDVELLLRKIKTKSNSGIVSVSLLTKPFACPGKCVYCPTEKQMPKSYLAKEPAASRALRNNFDPYKQVTTRLRALETNGHPVDKIEVIVIGGTWSYYPEKYQKEFISEIFRACNNYKRKEHIKKNAKSLDSLQKLNEKAKCRVIGLSVETRPDYISLSEIKKMRRLGVTKVEIGVQNLDDDVMSKNARGISKERIAEATALLRLAGLKIVYHMMPNLYTSTYKKDVGMFKELFSNSLFYPDMLKIYPCVVLKNSSLYKLWQKGEFKSYGDKKLAKLLIEVKKGIPKFVRLIRVIRDIPAEYIVAGSKISNLRQLLEADQIENNWKCKCIRCREIREADFDLNELILEKEEYETSVGKEVFLSWEKKSTDKIAAFARLFLPSAFDKSETLPVVRGCAIIRELHTYGRLVPVAEKGLQSQHRGLGSSLINEAEKMSKEAGYKKIAIISGIGVRDYYRKLGYRLADGYMVKSLI